MSLGRSHVSLPLCHGERPSNLDAAVRQVDITPSERYQLASTCSGECCESHGSTENRISVLRSLDQNGHLRWRRNLHLRPLYPRRCRSGCRSVVDPPPLHRLATGGRENAVVLVDRGRRERVQELLSGRDRNVSIAEMDSRSGPCVTIEILVSYRCSPTRFRWTTE